MLFSPVYDVDTTEPVTTGSTSIQCRWKTMVSTCVPQETSLELEKESSYWNVQVSLLIVLLLLVVNLFFFGH